MLLNSHNLYAVVSLLDYTRQDIVFEFLVCAHLLCILRHTNVALVDKQRRRVRLESLLLPFIFFLRSPYLSREYLCLIVLNNTAHPCRYALALTTVPLHEHLVEVAVLKGCLGKLYLPVLSVLALLQGILWRFLPAVEVADKVNLSSIRSPLAENPFALSVAMKAVIQITRSKIREFHLTTIRKMVYHPQCMVMTTTNSIFVWLKPWVIGNDANVFWRFRFHNVYI